MPKEFVSRDCNFKVTSEGRLLRYTIENGKAYWEDVTELLSRPLELKVFKLLLEAIG